MAREIKRQKSPTWYFNSLKETVFKTNKKKSAIEHLHLLALNTHYLLISELRLIRVKGHCPYGIFLGLTGIRELTFAVTFAISFLYPF